MTSKTLGNTIYELFCENGQRFGFPVVSWRPRNSFAVVKDFGKYKTVYGSSGKAQKVWVSLDPHIYPTTTGQNNVGFLVNVHRIETKQFEKTAMIFDTPSWQLY